MKLGARARVQLCDMRRELILRLDRRITGGNITLLGSVQLAIDAIDRVTDDCEETDGRLSLMPVSERAYTEIFENLSQPGYENVLVGENGEIDLKGVRLITPRGGRVIG
jgi:hypothetical protein